MPFISVEYCSTLERCREVADRNGIVIRRSYRKPAGKASPSRNSRYEVLIGDRLAAQGDAKAVKAFMRSLNLPGRTSSGLTR